MEAAFSVVMGILTHTNTNFSMLLAVSVSTFCFNRWGSGRLTWPRVGRAAAARVHSACRASTDDADVGVLLERSELLDAAHVKLAGALAHAPP